MQNIENDMDDLFRRAAENYPLNTGKGEWEKIDKKLAVPVAGREKKDNGKDRYKKLFLLLFFLLLSGIAAVYFYQPGTDKQLPALVSEKQKPIPDDKTEVQNKKNSPDQSTVTLPAKKKRATGLTENQLTNPATGDQANDVLKNKRVNNIGEKTVLEDPAKSYPGAQNAEAKKQDDDVARKIITRQQNTSSIEEKTEQDTADNSAKNLPTGKRNTKDKKTNVLRNRWYVQLVSDADFSKVKSTRFEGPAFGLGIMGGYRINNHLFVETGLIGFHKNYYSLGNAFSEKGAAMPTGMVINDLESKTKILEIPVKAGIYLYAREKTKYFVAAGASAYIMMNEKNSYNVTMNGTPEKMEGVYQKNNTKIPAVLNVSAGLQQNISHSLKIIIEPYLKLPLQGIGVGKLPVTSAGIQIGISGSLK